MEQFAAEKMVDARLRDFAARGAAEEVCSVIVELGMPPPRLPPHAVWPPRNLPRAGTARADLADIEGHAGLMDELEKLFQTLDLPAKPGRLNVAQAFVVSVTPEQLRTISRWPLVGAIRLNRTHYVPRQVGR